jgi:hypothetical protein
MQLEGVLYPLQRLVEIGDEAPVFTTFRRGKSTGQGRVKNFVSRGGKHSVRRKFAMEDRRTFNIQRRTSNGRKPNRRDRGWMMAA